LVELYGLDYESIKEMSQEAWKAAVEEAITTAFDDLTRECRVKTKTVGLKYEVLERQKYVCM
jgi:hypothetical protein